MDIFLRIFQIWTFYGLSIYIERSNIDHIPYHFPRYKDILYGDLFERSEISVEKKQTYTLYLSKLILYVGKVQVLLFLRFSLKIGLMEKLSK